MSNLNDFVIENGVLKSYKGKDNDVVIPDGVTTIGGYAFYGCEKLKSITIPNGVTWIAAHAFYDCESLTSITIPDSVTVIEYDAFWSCESLTIHAPAGSIAERYAKENRIPFIAE